MKHVWGCAALAAMMLVSAGCGGSAKKAASNRRYRDANRARINAEIRAWKAANPERVRASMYAEMTVMHRAIRDKELRANENKKRTKRSNGNGSPSPDTMASEIWSQTLSGWPSPTDSEVNR